MKGAHTNLLLRRIFLASILLILLEVRICCAVQTTILSSSVINGKQYIGGDIKRYTYMRDVFSIDLNINQFYDLEFTFTGPLGRVKFEWQPPGITNWTPFTASYYSSSGKLYKL